MTPSSTAHSRARSRAPVRAAAVGATCGAGAVLGHSLAAGSHADVVTSTVLLGVGLALGPVLVRRRSWTSVLAASLGLQLLGHVLMALTMSRTVVRGTPAATGGHGTAHGYPASDGPVPAALDAILGGGALMALTHVAVAVAAAALALGADHAVLQVLRDWWDAVLVPRPTRTPLPPRRRAPVPSATRRPARQVRPTAVAPRGPPPRTRVRTLPTCPT